ncbi:hypothetical protein KJU82_003968 [Salmonella enterica]|nr:hypothetical protein [Salmonella enterica]
MRPRLNGDVAGAAEKGEGDGEIGEDSILSRLNLYARWNLPAGVKETRYTLLLQLASCHRAVVLAAQLNMSPKTVSIYRRETMFRLNMEPSLVSLYRGLKVLKQLQRTPLMDEQGNLSEKA